MQGYRARDSIHSRVNAVLRHLVPIITTVAVGVILVQSVSLSTPVAYAEKSSSAISRDEFVKMTQQHQGRVRKIMLELYREFSSSLPETLSKELVEEYAALHDLPKLMDLFELKMDLFELKKWSERAFDGGVGWDYPLEVDIATVLASHFGINSRDMADAERRALRFAIEHCNRIEDLQKLVFLTQKKMFRKSSGALFVSFLEKKKAVENGSTEELKSDVVIALLTLERVADLADTEVNRRDELNLRGEASVQKLIDFFQKVAGQEGTQPNAQILALLEGAFTLATQLHKSGPAPRRTPCLRLLSSGGHH